VTPIFKDLLDRRDFLGLILTQYERQRGEVPWLGQGPGPEAKHEIEISPTGEDTGPPRILFQGREGCSFP